MQIRIFILSTKLLGTKFVDYEMFIIYRPLYIEIISLHCTIFLLMQLIYFFNDFNNYCGLPHYVSTVKGASTYPN